MRLFFRKRPTPTEAYCPRFGELAMARGYLTARQIKEALTEQRRDLAAGRPHRIIGTICFEKGWMTPGQIETVLNELFAVQQPSLSDAESLPSP